MTVATGLCGAAYAGDTTDIINVQLDNDPFTAGINVVAVDVVSVLGAATALGNTLSVDIATGDLTLDSKQTLSGAGKSESVISVNSATDGLDSLATTFGNSATITTCCGTIDAVSEQTIAADADMEAVSTVTAAGWADSATSTASAVGNALSYETWGGDRITAWAGQTNNSDVLSEATLNAGLLATSATITSTAIGNSATMGGENTTLDVDALQSNFGTSVFSEAVTIAASGENVINTATATGNTYNVENSFGFARVVSGQANRADVTALSDVTLTDWEGWNASSAYAVGNSTLASNIGSDLELNTTQTNDGGVEAHATFTGGTGHGGVGDDSVTDFVTSATAFGNAVSGYVCATCGGGIGANNRQTNSGSIVASSTVNAGSGGALIATASAVGNSATYQTVQIGQ